MLRNDEERTPLTTSNPAEPKCIDRTESLCCAIACGFNAAVQLPLSVSWTVLNIASCGVIQLVADCVVVGSGDCNEGGCCLDTCGGKEEFRKTVAPFALNEHVTCNKPGFLEPVCEASCLPFERQAYRKHMTGDQSVNGRCSNFWTPGAAMVINAKQVCASAPTMK